jgi:hypothetical protein
MTGFTCEAWRNKLVPAVLFTARTALTLLISLAPTIAFLPQPRPANLTINLVTLQLPRPQ